MLGLASMAGSRREASLSACCSALPGDEEHLAGVPGEEADGFVDASERHPVGDQPVEVEPTGVQQEHGLLPGLPEPSTEDAAKADALLVDVGGDVDLGRSAGVPAQI